MILLSALLHCDAESVRAITHINAASPFFDADLDAVPAHIGLEYMAQTVAAWGGANARAGGGSVKLGFLLGTRRYQPQVPAFPRGAELVIEAREVMRDDSGLGVYQCTIHGQGELWVEARLNVFQPDTPPTELRKL
jgi:predicted hotdog family 3-hydroxylacyl-ACP dehydratase